MRIQIALERMEMGQGPELNIESDLKNFLLNVAHGLIGSKGLRGFSYGESLMKTLSHLGGVPVPVETVKGVFQSRRGKQYYCERENVIDGTTGEEIMVFRLLNDIGNVAYHDYLVDLAGKDKISDMTDGMGLKAEKGGDVVECWLGMLDVASRTMEGVGIVIPGVERPENMLTGLNTSIEKFCNSPRVTYTPNLKRNRNQSFTSDVTGEEIEEVMRRAKEKDMYMRPMEFPVISKMDKVRLQHRIDMIRKSKAEGTDARSSQSDASAEEKDYQTQFEEQFHGSDDKGRRQSVNDALGAVFTASEEHEVCIFCGKSDHAHYDCRHPLKGQIKEIYNRLRVIINSRIDDAGVTVQGFSDDLKKKEKDEKDIDMEAEEEKKQEPSQEPRNEPADENPNIYFLVPESLSDLGDKDEGGQFFVNSYKIDSDGPKNSSQLEEIIEDAISKKGGYKMSCSKWDVVPDPEDDNGYFHRIKLNYETGFTTIIPTKGCRFDGYFKGDLQHAGVEFRPNERIDLNENEREIGRRLNKILRHYIGAKQISGLGGRKHEGVPCDAEAWVDIEDIFAYHHIWETVSDFRYVKGDNSPANAKEAFNRYDLMVKTIYLEKRTKRKTRFQILALAMGEKDYIPNSALIMDHRMTDVTNKIFRSSTFGPRCNELFITPLAIRATSGWSEPREPHVILDEEALSLPITLLCTLNIKGGFHTFDFLNLSSIVKHGLLPGGMKRGRSQLFFNPFAPWDQRSNSILMTTGVSAKVPAVIYINISKLIDFGAGMSPSGHIVTTKTIPFSAFSGMWYMDADGSWVRLLNRRTNSFIVRKVTSARIQAKTYKIAKMARDIIISMDDTRSTTRLSRDVEALLKIESIFDASNEQCKRLIDFVLDHYVAMEPGTRLCPSCFTEIPMDITTCYQCWGSLIAIGKEIIDLTGGQGQGDEEVPTRKPAPKAMPRDKEKEKQMDEGDAMDEETKEEFAQASKEYYKSKEDEPKSSDDQDVPMGDESEYQNAYDDTVPDWEADDVEEDVEMQDTEGGDEPKDKDEEADFDEDYAAKVREIPSWCKFPSVGSKVLTKIQSIGVDPSDQAGTMMDVMLGNIVKKAYNAYYAFMRDKDFLEYYETILKRGMCIPETQFMVPIEQDATGVTTVDEYGYPAIPSQEYLEEYFDRNAKLVQANHPGCQQRMEARIGDRNKGMFLAMARGMKHIQRITRYLMECDMNGKQLSFLLSDNRERDKYRSDDEKLTQMKINQHFIRRVIYGAFNVNDRPEFVNDVSLQTFNHAYFREDIDDPRFIHFNPFEIYCTALKTQRHYSFLVTMVSQGLTLPEYLKDDWERGMYGFKNSDEALLPANVVSSIRTLAVRGDEQNEPAHDAAAEDEQNDQTKRQRTR